MAIKNFSQYLIEAEREVFFTFGRMNPPTIGHGKVLETLARKSGKNDYKVFTSQVSNAKKDPLSYSDKIKHMRKMFPKHGRSIIINKKIRTAFDAVTELYDQGYRKVNMIVGSDRVREFDTILQKYNGVKGRHGFYNFESINVMSAGERDPDAEGVAGMSASKQRENAKENDYTAFAQGVPSSMSDKDTRKLFNDVRKGMGLKEETRFKRHVDLGKLNELRENYVQGNLYEIGDTVVIKSTEEIGVVSVLGSNYVVVETNGKRVRKWLQDIELSENTAQAKEDFIRLSYRAFQNMVKDFKKAGDNDTAKLANMAARMAERGAEVFQTWFNGRDKLDKMLLAGEIAFYTKQKDKTVERMLNYKFDEASLSPAQLKKRDEIKKAIDRDNPGMDKSKKIAIATATAKRVAQKIVDDVSTIMEKEKEKTKVAQDKDVKDKEGTQPSVYYKGVAKKTKDARASHFAKGSEMDDDNPAAYKDAPGDKKARKKGTKPSKHTKKFKQMFGEKAILNKRNIKDKKALQKAYDLLSKKEKEFKSNSSYVNLMNRLYHTIDDFDASNMDNKAYRELQRDVKKVLGRDYKEIIENNL